MKKRIHNKILKRKLSIQANAFMAVMGAMQEVFNAQLSAANIDRQAVGGEILKPNTRD